MTNKLAILDAMPTAKDFYEQYWNRRAFVVRSAIPASDLEGLIEGDELAGLSMEEGVLSRMVKTADDNAAWSCDFGPFVEEDFETTGDKNWSFLVQNVDQYHPETAALLQHFDFSPRWLLDDIMVSFSAAGGTIGPHIDSYHVFLTQGQGKRLWKVGREAIYDEEVIEGLELKILKHGFEGDEIEMTSGDVLYVPPKFGHEGTTLENALTYSVGFLGPKLSELLISYGQYLSECEDIDQLYAGNNLNEESAGFMMSNAAVQDFQGMLCDNINSPSFRQWLVEFFTEAAHDDFGNYTEREDVLSLDELTEALTAGGGLIKPEYVKFAVTMSPDQQFCLGFDNHSFVLDERLFPLVQRLMKEESVSIDTYPALMSEPAYIEFLLELYNHQALEFLA